MVYNINTEIAVIFKSPPFISTWRGDDCKQTRLRQYMDLVATRENCGVCVILLLSILWLTYRPLQLWYFREVVLRCFMQLFILSSLISQFSFVFHMAQEGRQNFPTAFKETKSEGRKENRREIVLLHCVCSVTVRRIAIRVCFEFSFPCIYCLFILYDIKGKSTAIVILTLSPYGKEYTIQYEIQPQNTSPQLWLSF